MFDGGVMEAFPQFFPARALGHCYVGARHDKLAAYDTPNGEVAYDFPTSVAGEPEKSSLGLHWDPLQISVFGTTYHKDQGVIGGDARIVDLPAYLRDHGNLRVDSAGRSVPLCTRPYPPIFDDVAYARLEAEYQQVVPLHYDCITLLFLVNYIDLQDADVCGLLHDGMPWRGEGKRRVGLASIQDSITADCAGYMSLPNPWVQYPYVTPPFRSMATSIIRAQLDGTTPRKQQGYYDGLHRKWVLDAGPE
jgi:hypothetical protein